MLVCVCCCSMCAGGDDDLLLLATEVGVVEMSVRGDGAQVVAPMASEGSNGEDTVNFNLRMFHMLFLHVLRMLYVSYRM